MFVTNHVLAGAVIGNRYPDRPVTAFLLGMGSHLAMDTVPHWGCDVSVDGGPERFHRAARRDGLLGLVAVGGVVLTAGHRRRVATVAAIAGSVLLDLDKPIEYFFGLSPFPEIVQRVHGGIQRESDARMPVEVAGGGLLAVATTWLTARARQRERGPRTPHGRLPRNHHERSFRTRHEPATQCSSAGQSRATLPS